MFLPVKGITENIEIQDTNFRIAAYRSLLMETSIRTKWTEQSGTLRDPRPLLIVKNKVRTQQYTI